jgi:cell wall-associated NlpC family hydrolase
MSSTHWYKSIILTLAATAAAFIPTAAQQQSPLNDTADGPSYSWGLVRLSVASMRAQPSHSSEQVSQALMGTPVKITRQDGGWSHVTTPDGYSGHIIDHSLQFLSDSAMARWCESPRVAVTATHEFMATDSAGHPVTDLVNGCILQILPDGTLLTPDRRRITPREKAYTMLGQWSSAPFRPQDLPRFAERFTGVVYLWGGMSGKGMDCSGLVRMAYAAQGRILPRDAWQQATQGTEITSTDSLRAGDLIFFGNPQTKRITHVAIYDRDGEYIHASQMVRRNSLRKDSPLYLPLHIITMRRAEGKSFPVGRIL